MDQAVAPSKALARKSTCKLIAQFFIHPKEMANLPAPDPHVTGRDICIRPDMPVQLCHKGLTEAHNLPVRSSQIKISPAQGQRSQRILEHLLKGQKFHNPRFTEGWKYNPP